MQKGDVTEIIYLVSLNIVSYLSLDTMDLNILTLVFLANIIGLTHLLPSPE